MPKASLTPYCDICATRRVRYQTPFPCCGACNEMISTYKKFTRPTMLLARHRVAVKTARLVAAGGGTHDETRNAYKASLILTEKP